MQSIEINALLATATASLGLLTQHHGISLSVPAGMLEQVLGEERFLAMRRNSDKTFPYVRLSLTPELAKFVNENCIYKVNEDTTFHLANDPGNVARFTKSYYLELLENGRLLVKYQQILGSRILADLDEAQLAALLARLKIVLGEAADAAGV